MCNKEGSMPGSFKLFQLRYIQKVHIEAGIWQSLSNGTAVGIVCNYDPPKSITKLWPKTVDFLAEHPEYFAKNNAMDWLTDPSRRPEHNRLANGYSTCHFWSNFEVAGMTFWRSKTYEDYFTRLDKAGSFFYERQGDTPVHSIAIGLFEDKSKVHW